MDTQKKLEWTLNGKKSEPSKILGKKVFIKTSVDSFLAGEWGIVAFYDGDRYSVAPWGSDKETMIFNRDEFTVPKKIFDPISKTIVNQ